MPGRQHRLHALCPYFAMFPVDFARECISATSLPGDLILDPFCGRGTTILEALLGDRDAIGGDINPVAAVVSQAKAQPPKLTRVLLRLEELEHRFAHAGRRALTAERAALPYFFSLAFAPSTLVQLLFLRKILARPTNRTDRFILALLLGHLHGETNRSKWYLSNQMPHAIAPKPRYAIRYWKERHLNPPPRDVFAVLRDRTAFRLRDEPPTLTGRVVRCDVRKMAKRFPDHAGQVTSVVTSPPYLDVTSYEEDQWLRLWFLGGAPHPTYNEVSHDDRHTNINSYFEFLSEAWRGIRPLLKPRAQLVCRIGTRTVDAKELALRLDRSIKTAWPKARQSRKPSVSELRNRQTDTFRPGSTGCRVEFDFWYELLS